MKHENRKALSAALVSLTLILASNGSARAADSPDGLWRDDDAVNMGEREVWIQPNHFRSMLLSADALDGLIARTPMEFGPGDDEIISLPHPDGGFHQFFIRESPVMEPELAAKFPEIKTFVGQGIDDPAAALRMDRTPAGFHAQVLTPEGSYYIDPRFKNDATTYASYYKRDYPRPENVPSCLTPPGPTPWVDEARKAGVAMQRTGETLRTYRVAVGCTGEFTAFHGGTQSGGLAAVVTLINRITGIYEIDFSIRLTLVANNNLIVYTNAGSDPYTNNDGVAMLSQNQSTCNSVIGSANYDIGHAFSTAGGGVAGLGVVCVSSQKGRGVSGQPSPIGDPFSVDYVAHEMGHQFGGNHSFNGTGGSCSGGNRNGPTAYEPGSGSTIMAYAGICNADNLQNNSDAYFHSINYTEIRSFVTAGSGSACDVTSTTGNADPTVSAGVDYVIPRNTPFALTATGSDPDGDTVSYCWEQRDLGAAQALSAADNGTSPIIRSFNPTTNPTRTVPRLSNLLNNTFAVGEKLPSANRTMDFRVTIRDNRAGSGGVATDDMIVTVVAAAGPFVVTFPNTAMTLSGTQTVTWNVANTTSAPVNAANVDILMSTNGGNTWPITLATAVPNDGSESVVLPEIPTTTARIKVAATGNIFFDISNANFTIVDCPTPAAPIDEDAPVAKNRYISFKPQHAGQTALRVILADLPPPFDLHNGETRWVGPPTFNPDGAHPGQDFWAAPLQCDPHFRDWSTLGTLHVYGEEVVPEASYEVQTGHCDLGVSDNLSGVLPITTGVWGDVVEPFVTSQPNISDVAALVDAFKEIPEAVVKVRAQLDGEEVNPAASLTIRDVAHTIDAFRDRDYPYAGPGSCGP